MTQANVYPLVLPLGDKCHEEVTISHIGMNELKEVLLIFKHYFPYGPLFVGAGASFEDMEDFVKNCAAFCLKQNMSVGARNKEGELVGFVLLAIEREGDNILKHLAAFAEKNEKGKKLLSVLGYTKDKYDVFSDQGVKEVMCIASAKIHPEYRGGKIAVDMLKMAEKKAIEKGLKVLEYMATGIRDKVNGQKIGMKPVSESDYKNFDFLDVTKVGSSTHCTFMVKKLH